VISKVKGIDFEAAKIVAAEIIVRTDLIRRSHRNSDGRKGERSSGKNGATPQQSTNCTMAAYAKAKQLTPEFLRSVGVVEISYCSHPALKIPYRDMSGAEAAVRFRVSLEGKDKFRWRKGSKPLLYGLDRINEARTANAVTIVEGESDCHTLWQAGFPAFGLPGANNWNEGRDAAIFEGIGNIFVVIESDAGGEQVINWLAKSKIRDRVKLVRLQGFKDPSALYLNDPASFAQRWQTALDNSVTWRDEAECKRQAARDAAWRVCQGVAQCPNILDQPVGESAQVDSTASERGPHTTP
jgi:hypothetical protein